MYRAGRSLPGQLRSRQPVCLSQPLTPTSPSGQGDCVFLLSGRGRVAQSPE